MVEHSSKIHEININWNVTKLYGNERWCHDFQWSHHVVETRWFIMIRSLGWTSDFLMKARTGQTATHGLNWQLYNAALFFYESRPILGRTVQIFATSDELRAFLRNCAWVGGAQKISAGLQLSHESFSRPFRPTFSFRSHFHVMSWPMQKWRRVCTI